MGTGQTIYQITVETETPLHIGSGKVDLRVDRPVVKDWNSLPFIPGTSIVGVLRGLASKYWPAEWERLFGIPAEGGEEGEGAKILSTNGLLIGGDNRVLEGLEIGELDNFRRLFLNLPIRDRTALDEMGVAKEYHKFELELVPKGSRFRFFLILEGEAAEKIGDAILELLLLKEFRLGGSTTSGYGKVKVLEVWKREGEIGSFIPSLNFQQEFPGEFEREFQKIELENLSTELREREGENFYCYQLKLTPEGPFFFGSGREDEEAELTPLIEEVVDYSTLTFKPQLVIPGSGLKGALSHRVAYLYNTFKNREGEFQFGEENPAVATLFGVAKGRKGKGGREGGEKGKIYFTDFFCPVSRGELPILPGIGIDRFLGGVLEGALFFQRVVFPENLPGGVELDILVKRGEGVEEYLPFFEKALLDLAGGALPVGGGSRRGFGFFTGEVYRDGEKIEKVELPERGEE